MVSMNAPLMIGLLSTGHTAPALCIRPDVELILEVALRIARKIEPSARKEEHERNFSY